MYKSNISLRTALKIIKPIKEFKFKDIDEYYKRYMKSNGRII